MKRLIYLILVIGNTLTFAGRPPGEDEFGALRAIEPPSSQPPQLTAVFEPVENEVIAFLGGTNQVEAQLFGYLESMLVSSWPLQQIRVRNLAWQADTVYRQQRPQYFFDSEHQDKRAGSSADERKRVRPTSVFVRFGKMESLDGLAALPRFRAALSKLLDELSKVTPRVVVVTPTPFFEAGPAAKLAVERNRVLVAYCQVMADVSEERGLFFADLYQFEPDRPYSENGIHLNEAGQRAIAERLMHQLRGKPKAFDEAAEKLRPLILRKNQIWYQYFRPTNWAFLYGDRQHVPSSRDHTDQEKRWFPTELGRALPLITELETKIYETANH